MVTENDPFIGKQLGTYHIQTKLGEGGMARVYKAYHLRLRREVAIKVILSQVADEDDFQARFEREAQVIASLEHPNIVSVHDFGETNNLTYLVMQYVGGGTLRDQLRGQRPLTVSRAINYTTQIAHALYHAHQRGIIHRDVKPPNILISATNPDHALLSDFGIAKLYWSNEDSPASDMPTRNSNQNAALTSVDQIIGTADYMAPEQANGLPVDARTDVYALGIVLYHMLAGEVPFHSTTLRGLLYQHTYTAPPSVREKNPQVPEVLANIVAKAMAKAPGDRFQSAEAMAQALASANANMISPQISPFPGRPSASDLPTDRFTSMPATQEATFISQQRPNAAYPQQYSRDTTGSQDRTQLSAPGMTPTISASAPNTYPGFTNAQRPPVSQNARKRPLPLSYIMAAVLIVISLVIIGTRVLPGWLAQSPGTGISQNSTGPLQPFTETFQNNSRNWLTGNLNDGFTTAISNGHYSIIVSQAITGFPFPQALGTLPRSFTLSTTIEQTAGSKDIFYGLAFRFNQANQICTTCYALIIDGSGTYQIREYGHGYSNASAPLWQGTYTGTGNTHTLQVKGNGSTYTFSIDGHAVAATAVGNTLSNSDIPNGGLALVASGPQATFVDTRVQLAAS